VLHIGYKTVLWNDKFCCDSELRIGYAYDRTISDLKVSAPSSHEFILLYDLFTPKKVSRSPRFLKFNFICNENI
jgi:hypothetical protein